MITATSERIARCEHWIRLFALPSQQDHKNRKDHYSRHKHREFDIFIMADSRMIYVLKNAAGNETNDTACRCFAGCDSKICPSW